MLTSTIVQLNICKKESKYTSTYSDFNRQKIIWTESKLPQYQRMVSDALSDALVSWNTPESIPHLTSLVSRLFVTSAVMVFNSGTQKPNNNLRKPCLKIRQAQNRLKRAFLLWKQSGKPTSKADPVKAAYAQARSELQSLRRQVDNLSNIKQNNYLMHLNHTNRSKIFKFMKRMRGHDHSPAMTNVLNTPVGTYSDEDILEGFAADTEYLGKSNDDNNKFDQKFYRLCKLDNHYIFDFLNDEPLSVPPMTLSQLNHILHVKMKPGKACDVYQVTVEHLRHCGDQAKLHLLTLINRILNDLHYLSCPQIKLGVGSAVFKGKKKPISKSSSYRRVTVTPIIGAIIDYYLDPKAEAEY